jgi:diguanylate cyclase (GGDEF)-like protein
VRGVAAITLMSVLLALLLKQLIDPQGADWQRTVPIAALIAVTVGTLFTYRYNLLYLQLWQSRQEMERQSRTDELTGVLNRRTFYEAGLREVSLAKRHAYPLSLLLVDLDHFRQVNDVQGAACGDGVLVELVQRIQQKIRVTDIFCRYGGEEFVLLLPHTPANQALILADRLRLAVAGRPFRGEDSNFSLTVSIGLAELQEGEALDGLLERADHAVYSAKQDGRDQCCLSGERAVVMDDQAELDLLRDADQLLKGLRNEGQ